LNQINLVRLLASKESSKAAREIAESQSERKNDAAEEKAHERLNQLEAELAAMEVREKSFGVGFVWGAAVSFASEPARRAAGRRRAHGGARRRPRCVGGGRARGHVAGRDRERAL
jgi:hypothetical protein